MKFSLALLTSALTALVAADGCVFHEGNYYCNAVEAITYENVGYSGTYKDVVEMNSQTCGCEMKDKSFSGPLAPFDEELSFHFRGPLNLAQFAVYYPSSKKEKRDAKHHRHHKHPKRDPDVHVEKVTQVVYVDAAANVNVHAGGGAAPTPCTTTISSSSSVSITTSPAPNAKPTGSVDVGNAAWTRTSYYAPGSADNVVFMNQLGGTAGSGSWDWCNGNSLSFLSSDGKKATSKASALDDVTVDANVEFMMFSGESCDDGKDGCGYYRSGAPAYHGWGGGNKIFLFEFTMPHGTSTGLNPDMPAIWALNAKVPRTTQYGGCSCWGSGCGELDLFEVINTADERMITHIHNGQGSDGTASGGGGCQDYFKRPTDKSMKAAVVFDAGESKIHLVKLDDDTDFSQGLTAETIEKWLSKEGSTAQMQ